MAYSSQIFYQNRLQAHGSVAKQSLFKDDKPVLFIDTAGCGFEEKLEGTKSNENKPKKINPYSKIGTEIKFIHRFLAFHDKILYKNTFEIFIDELQKAIQKNIPTIMVRWLPQL